jgi:hypothetical protein
VAVLPDTTPTDAAAVPDCERCPRWRKLATYGFAAIDMALDADPGERIAILAEAAAELDGAIDELDAAASETAA